MQGDEENQGLPEESADLSLSVSEAALGDLPAPAGEAAPEALPEGMALPEEDPTSGTSLDEILSSEVLPEGAHFVLPEADELPLPSAPSFQLYFVSLPEAQRAPLKKILEAQAIAVSEKAWASPAPMISQLTEYQAISLMQSARALGLAVSAMVQRPLSPLPTEEDLALGDLAGVGDAPRPQMEAAPSVALPKGEKEVMLCTPEQMPGVVVQESFGIVLAHRSIARRLFREEDLREKLEKELKSVPNRPSSPLPSSHLQILLRDLLLDLRKAALAKGANAVLGVKMEAFPEAAYSDPQLEQLRLVAFGTAAVVEKV